MASDLSYRRDKYSTFQSGGITFAMDNGCLLIKVREDYPMPLSAQATHRLLNMLFDHRKDIIEANTKALRYESHPYPEHQKPRRKIDAEAL